MKTRVCLIYSFHDCSNDKKFGARSETVKVLKLNRTTVAKLATRGEVMQIEG